jgi:Xaa-Pro dipeptidase
LLTRLGLAGKRLGIEPSHHSLTVLDYQRLRARLPQVTFVDASQAVEVAMLVKSPAEIAVMRRAAALSRAGMLAAIERAAEGQADNDLAAAAYQAIIAHGGEYFSLQPIVTAGRRSGIPHTTFRRMPLRRGDTVFVEVSAAYERYSAPILRTVSVGQPSADVQRAMDACLASVNTLIEQIRPGVRGCDIARRAGAALRAIEPDLVWHGIYGYSVGLTFPPMCSDCPNADITETSEAELQPGMVFHCNTSLRNIGQFGVTASETVLVTETGTEVLTDVPRQLFVR